jgi:ABC-type phosphate/phosphonate transport system substrate-binding protein
MNSIRMVTWLAPGIPLALFEHIREHLQDVLGVPVSLESRTKRSGPASGSADPFADDIADMGFLCAPAAVPASIRQQAGFDLLGLAPLYDDPRYAGQPRCYCDIVVREDTAGSGLQATQGMTLGYNDTSSLSGWLGLSHELQKQQTRPERFFGQLIHTGGHLTSIERLLDGSIQVASIDSNVLRTHPGVMQGLRVIDSVGPWPAQPVVVRRSLDSTLKAQLRAALGTCGPWPQWSFIGFRPQDSTHLGQVPIAAQEN